MSPNLTRRQFLLTSGAAASASLFSSPLSLFDRAEASQHVVRRGVDDMSAHDPVLVSYQKAVKAMKALPERDTRSWAYQAAIYGTAASKAKIAWNTAQHGNYFFWSWHRMYLYWFERIVRKFSQDPHWALPYWDWSAPSGRQIPGPFRDPSSELFVADRRTAMNAGGILPPSHTDYTQAFTFSGFSNASLCLESTPVGAVHVDVGGWMGSVVTAAQDPLFYVHGANIDRLWSLWLTQGGGRMDPTGDTAWTKHRFTFFNENGKPVQMTSCDVLRATEELHYIYEGSPVQEKQYCSRKPVTAPIGPIEEALVVPPVSPITLTSEPITVSIDITNLSGKLHQHAEHATDQILLDLRDVEAASNPGVVWDVFVGLPKGTTADAQSPAFVGSLALFGTGIRNEAPHGFHPARFVFPIKRPLLTSLAQSSGELSVLFVPQGVLVDGKPLPPDVTTPVRIGRLGIIVERTQVGRG